MFKRLLAGVSSPLLLLFCCCCQSNQGLSSLCSANINNDRREMLSVGMKQKEVLRIMHKPYSYETFQIEDDIFDIWFYVTLPTGLGQTRMVHQNLTPLAFKNGVLIGWGYHYYNRFIEQKRIEEAKPSVEEPLELTDREDSTKGRPTQDSEEEDEQLPPDEEGRDMLEDDAEDDFNTW